MENENSFTADALCKSKAFKEYKDVLRAVLSEDREYTKAEAWELIENYLKKEMC